MRLGEEKIEFLSGIALVSRNTRRLAEFYNRVIGLPLLEERRGEGNPSYACALGDLRFQILPVGRLADGRAGVGAVRLSFTVFDLRAFLRRLKQRGLKTVKPVRETDVSLTTTINDPDRNLLTLTQFCDGWFDHLARRRARGVDVIRRWTERRLAGSGAKGLVRSAP